MEGKKLEDWPIKIIDGDRSSRYPKRKEMVNEGVLFLSTPSIVDGAIDASVSNFITQEKFDSISKGRLQDSDIVMTTRGTIGKLAFFKSSSKYPTGLINAQMLILRADPEVIRPKYLFYLMGSDKYQTQIKSFSSGSAQPQIPITDLKKTTINFPKIVTQDAVVEVIDNYTNFIENNNRRIAILEDMAQSLYREWFVNFRYPDYQDNLDADGSLKLVDSPLGKIPEGWEVKRLNEVASVNPESISTKNAPSEICYIDIKSVGTGTIDEVKPMLFSDAPSRARRIVADGDIIWATVRPNRKQYSFICKPIANTIASTGFAVLRGKTLPASYLYSFTTTDNFTGYLVNHATGSAYPAVNSDVFKKADVLVPPLELLKKFDVICSDALSQSEVLKKKNKNLKQQRDMLLPKLISGTIKL